MPCPEGSYPVPNRLHLVAGAWRAATAAGAWGGQHGRTHLRPHVQRPPCLAARHLHAWLLTACPLVLAATDMGPIGDDDDVEGTPAAGSGGGGEPAGGGDEDAPAGGEEEGGSKKKGVVKKGARLSMGARSKVG